MHFSRFGKQNQNINNKILDESLLHHYFMILLLLEVAETCVMCLHVFVRRHKRFLALTTPKAGVNHKGLERMYICIFVAWTKKRIFVPQNTRLFINWHLLALWWCFEQSRWSSIATPRTRRNIIILCHVFFMFLPLGYQRFLAHTTTKVSVNHKCGVSGQGILWKLREILCTWEICSFHFSEFSKYFLHSLLECGVLRIACNVAQKHENRQNTQWYLFLLDFFLMRDENSFF